MGYLISLLRVEFDKQDELKDEFDKIAELMINWISVSLFINCLFSSFFPVDV